MKTVLSFPAESEKICASRLHNQTQGTYHWIII